MRIFIIITSLLLCTVAKGQKGWYWANVNKSPKLAKIFAINGQSGTGQRTHSLSSIPSGALIVITVQSEDDQGDAAISSSPSLTWTKRADATLATHSGNAEIWTAVFTAGGSITITSNFGASSEQSSTAWVITGQEPTLGGATAVVASQSAPSRTITSTRANSILICVSSDWNAVNGSSRAYRDNATEGYYYFSAANTTGYHYFKLAPTVTTYTEGLTAPTGQSSGTAILEIRSP